MKGAISMIRRTGSILLILLLFMSVFIGVGYAALTENLFISGEGTITAKPYEGVYISNVSLHLDRGAVNVSSEYYKPTNFLQTARASMSGGSVTYKVTFHNNSNVTYWYIRPDFLSEYESNGLIGASSGITILTKDHPDDTYSSFNSSDWIPPNTYRDVYVTYTYGSGAQGYQVTLVNYLFGVKMDSVHDKFLTALNDSGSGGAYEMITRAFDEKYRETGERVLANIGDEADLFNQLFGSNLTISVDGQNVPVTVIVRRENVDSRSTGDSYSTGGGSGCEYTVYITVDALSSPTGKAITYAVSYSKGGTADALGAWYQLGELYEGTANRIDYDSSTPGVQGAVDVYSWIASPKRYEVANGITYLVGQEQGDQYDKLKTLEQLMSTNDQDIFNDIDNTRVLKNAYDIVHNSANYSKPGYSVLREAFYAAQPFYNVYNNGQEVKVKRQGTRAEIVPYIEAIQKAMDYFNEVN